MVRYSDFDFRCSHGDFPYRLQIQNGTVRCDSCLKEVGVIGQTRFFFCEPCNVVTVDKLHDRCPATAATVACDNCHVEIRPARAVANCPICNLPLAPPGRSPGRNSETAFEELAQQFAVMSQEWTALRPRAGDPGPAQEIEPLISSLETQISALQLGIASLQNSIESINNSVAECEERLQAIESIVRRASFPEHVPALRAPVPLGEIGPGPEPVLPSTNRWNATPEALPSAPLPRSEPPAVSAAPSSSVRPDLLPPLPALAAALIACLHNAERYSPHPAYPDGLAPSPDGKYILIKDNQRALVLPGIPGVDDSADYRARLAAAFECASPSRGAVMVEQEADAELMSNGLYRITRKGRISIH